MNPRVTAESLEVIYPLKGLIQEVAHVTSSLASWARPGHTIPPTHKGLESVWSSLPMCPGRTQKLATSTTTRNLQKCFLGNRRGDRNPLFRKHRMPAPSPTHVTNIFEQMFGASHRVTTNQTDMALVFQELTNGEDRCNVGEVTTPEDAGACWTVRLLLWRLCPHLWVAAGNSGERQPWLSMSSVSKSTHLF